MHITVRLFARARDLAGTERCEITLPEGAKVRDARAVLLTVAPQLSTLAKTLFMAIDGEYASDETRLTDGCELAAFPPVSGG